MKVFFIISTFFFSLAAAAAPGTLGVAAGPLVNLHAQTSREVTNDLMHATMSVEREDRDAARAADTVNKTLREARSIAEKYKGIAIESGSYQSYPVHDRNGRSIVGWRVRAELRLKGRDFDRMSALIGTLQSSMQFNGLEFTVSPETRRAAENELIGEAVSAFRQRAQIAQQALQATSYIIREIDLNTQHEGMPPPRPMARMATQMREDAAVAAPVAEPGTSRVTVTASGTIELR